jgi:hypothetical protein
LHCENTACQLATIAGLVAALKGSAASIEFSVCDVSKLALRYQLHTAPWRFPSIQCEVNPLVRFSAFLRDPSGCFLRDLNGIVASCLPSAGEANEILRR